MTVRFLILAIAMLLSGNVLAQEPAKPPPFNASAYPPEVQKALHTANEECPAEEGGKVSFAPDTVRKLDLTGDGRNDYIVDFRDTACSARASAYCGTGGCVMDILVTLPGGQARRVFDGYVRSYEILPGKGARAIRFELHGGYCGGHGNPSCIREHRITAKPFEFKIPQ